MISEESIRQAIKENKISKIAIVDDAFDAPEIEESNAGDFLDYLGTQLFEGLAQELSIDEGIVTSAKRAIAEGDYDADSIRDLVSSLYLKYVDTLDERYNPKEIFSSQRDNIRNLDPILKLLNRCEPSLNITRFGSDLDSIRLFDEETQLVFMDFFLERGVNESASPAKQRGAKAEAVDRISSLIRKQQSNAASVILMSSADKRKEAEDFREEITVDDKSLVFASRFAFVRKTEFKVDPDHAVQISHEAGDELLDVLQSFEFARGTHAALELWYKSAQAAANTVRAEIAKLGLKDFAFLHRFRLSQEGQELLAYLEWFFGQCLLDHLARQIDKDSKSDERLAVLKDGAAQKRIEGTFDGPTKAIASLYHKARIEDPRGAKHSVFRLGDLFVSGTGSGRMVHAVLNPDCDLVPRGPKAKLLAKRSITVSGSLSKFDAPTASVSEFIQLDKQYNITWQKKNIQTVEFEDLRKEPYKFVGTLRSMYAHELQNRILSDLGRVGVSVAPAMGITARAQVFLRKANNQTAEVKFGSAKVADCYVIPSRGGDDKAVVLFKRSFATHLLAELSNLDRAGLHDKAIKGLETVLKPENLTKLSRMHQKGVRFDEFIDADLGILLTAKNPPVDDHHPWCFLKTKMIEEDA